MKITREAYGIKAMSGKLGAVPGQADGAPPEPDCCDPDEADLPDRAAEENGGDAWTLVPAAPPDYVQSATSALLTGNSTTSSAVWDIAPTEGNLLVSAMFHRGGSGVSHTPPDGWTALTPFDNFYGRVEVAWKIASDAESGTVTWTHVLMTQERAVQIVEYEGGGATILTSTGQDTAGPDLTLPTISPDAGLPAIIFMALMQQPSEDPDYDPPWTERENVFSGSGNRSRYEIHDRIVSSTSGPYGGETATVSDGSTDAAHYLVAFTFDGPQWLGDGSEAIDGEGGTYVEVTGPELLRIDLGAPHRIRRAALQVALSASSARELTILASNDPDMVGAVTLATIDFTSTGSFTPQDLASEWLNDIAYRYVQLDADDTDTWRIHRASFYEGTLAIDLDEHLTDAEDAHDASSISYDNGASGLSATTVQDAIDEIVDEGVGGGGEDVTLVSVAAAGAAETIDCSVARTYDITFDDDCTITLAGAVDDESHFVTVLVRESGAGGWTLTWPGSVTWEGAPVTTTDAEMQVVTLFTVDGGTTWVAAGLPAGGGADLSDAIPLVEAGAGDAGVSSEASRADHVHPEDEDEGGEDKTFSEVASPGATETIDCTIARVHRVTLDDDTAITLTGAAGGEAHRVTILLRQNGTGGWEPTFTNDIYWPGGISPTWATDPWHTDWVDLISVDGTNWLGVLNGADHDTPSPPVGGSYWPMLALTSA